MSECRRTESRFTSEPQSLCYHHFYHQVRTHVEKRGCILQSISTPWWPLTIVGTGGADDAGASSVTTEGRSVGLGVAAARGCVGCDPSECVGAIPDSGAIDMPSSSTTTKHGPRQGGLHSETKDGGLGGQCSGVRHHCSRAVEASGEARRAVQGHTADVEGPHAGGQHCFSICLHSITFLGGVQLAPLPSTEVFDFELIMYEDVCQRKKMVEYLCIWNTLILL